MELLACRHFAAGCRVFFSLVGGSGQDDHAISYLINKIQNYLLLLRSGEWSGEKSSGLLEMRALGRSLKRILCRMMPITSSSTSGGSCSPQPAFVFVFLSTSRGFLSVTFVPASSWYPTVKVYPACYHMESTSRLQISQETR